LKPFNTFKPSKSLKALRAQEVVPIPSVLAQEIVEDLEAALEQFRKIATESVGISSEIRPLDKISVNEG
jgi:hypothetical protein